MKSARRSSRYTRICIALLPIHVRQLPMNTGSLVHAQFLLEFYIILVGVFIRWFEVIPVKHDPMSTRFKIHVQILSTFYFLDWSYSCESMGPGSWIYAQILLVFYTLDLGYSCEKRPHRYVIQDLCSNFVNISLLGLRQLL